MWLAVSRPSTGSETGRKAGDHRLASFIPVAAFMLARMTHAPELVWIASSVGLEPRPERIPASTLEAPLWRDSIMYLDQYTDFWNFVLNGRWIQKFCVSAAQLDQYGNANNSIIGDDYHRPRVRLPGTAGLADMCSIGKDLYYWNPDHSPEAWWKRSITSRVPVTSMVATPANNWGLAVDRRRSLPTWR